MVFKSGKGKEVIGEESGLGESEQPVSGFGEEYSDESLSLRLNDVQKRDFGEFGRL